MKQYKFNDCLGKEYVGEFKSVEDAKQYAYKSGLCFIGRI